MMYVTLVTRGRGAGKAKNPPWGEGLMAHAYDIHEQTEGQAGIWIFYCP
jgi:hypothetical protein